MPNEKQLFPLGQVVMTPGAREAFQKTGQQPLAFVDRHAQGDYGDLTSFDKRANQLALKDGSRIMSVYKLMDGTKVWVITNAAGDDGLRDATTVLLPDEY